MHCIPKNVNKTDISIPDNKYKKKLKVFLIFGRHY